MIKISRWRFSSLTQTYNTLLTQATTIKLQVRRVVNLSFKLIGTGTTHHEEPPIFLLHGLLSRKKLMKGIGKTMLNLTKRTVVAVDLRNHGTSPHISSHKYDEMASDLIQLFDKLEVKRASLVGHSMGGRAAMCVSMIAPHRVERLLVVDISPVSTPEQMKQMLKILLAIKAVDFKNSKKISKAQKEAKKQLKEVIQDDITMRAVLSNVTVKNDGKIGWMFNLEVLIKQFKYIASFPKSMRKKKFDGPCLFIGGQLSEYIPADDLVSIREMFPKAVITYIPKVGHNVHAEDPKTFMEQAIAFLKTSY